jgi:FkbM family methyltransferase
VSKKIGPYGPFKLNGRFAFANYAAWGNAHNAAFERCIEACRPSDVVIDVGAHIGLVTLCASVAVGDGGRVIAFEPAEGNLAYLRDHVALNGRPNIEVVEALVGAEERSEVEFFETRGDSGLNSRSMARGSDRFMRCSRRQVTIDGFCRERGLRPRVLKIDVEGAEFDVLRGARRVLAEAEPMIFLSVHPHQLAELGASVDVLRNLIVSLDYRIEGPDGVVASTIGAGEYVVRPVGRRH